MTTKFLDLDKLDRSKFKRSRGRPLSKAKRDGVKLMLGWWDSDDEWTEFHYDLNCPYSDLTPFGKKIAIEYLNDVIIDLCKSDPHIAAEYEDMIMNAFIDKTQDEEEADSE